MKGLFVTSVRTVLKFNKRVLLATDAHIIRWWWRHFPSMQGYWGRVQWFTLQPGIKLATIWSWVWRWTSLAIPNCLLFDCVKGKHGIFVYDRCMVNEMWSKGEKVTCGVITSETRVSSPVQRFCDWKWEWRHRWVQLYRDFATESENYNTGEFTCTEIVQLKVRITTQMSSLVQRFYN